MNETLARLKKDALAISVPILGVEGARLVPLTEKDAQDPRAIALLAKWRHENSYAFPSQFQVTEAGTERWLRQGVLEEERLLFWVTVGGERLGHMGLFRFDWKTLECEVDNIVRGERGGAPGLIYHALNALIAWTFETFKGGAIFLRVYSDNERALTLYRRLGFQETMRFPLERKDEGATVRWVEVTGEYRKPVARYFVTMRLLREDWDR